MSFTNNKGKNLNVFDKKKILFGNGILNVSSELSKEDTFFLKVPPNSPISSKIVDTPLKFEEETIKNKDFFGVFQKYINNSTKIK